MEFPKHLRYSPQHEWVSIEGDLITMGITDFAQDALGDIVWLELAETGQRLGSDKSLLSILP